MRITVALTSWARRYLGLVKGDAAPAYIPTVEDTLVFAYEHNLLEADGIIGRGQWCVVRRDLKTRRVVRYALGEGTSRRVAGTELDV